MDPKPFPSDKNVNFDDCFILHCIKAYNDFFPAKFFVYDRDAYIHYVYDFACPQPKKVPLLYQFGIGVQHCVKNTKTREGNQFCPADGVLTLGTGKMS